MRGVMKTCVRAAAPLLVGTLVGCAVVDNFSGRAVDFNLQAEQVQEQDMLLNVVRASLRRPMQFTGLQSITGNASVSGNGSLTFPFGPPGHRPPKSLSADSLALGGTISGGPTFIVPVLDTQEFYEGILNPISLQVFDYYLEQGFPPEMLFDLFVSKVVVTWTKNNPGARVANCAHAAGSTSSGGITAISGNESCIDITYTNSVASDADFNQFQAIVDLLFAEGLTTEHVENTSRLGPPIATKDLAPPGGPDNGRQVAALLQAYAAAAQAGLKLTKANNDEYQLEKNTTSYRFCFRSSDPALIDSSLLCGHARAGAEKGAAPPAAPGRKPAGGAGVEPPPRAPEAGSAGVVNASGTTDFNLSLSKPAQETLTKRLQAATSRIPKAALPPLENMHVTSFQIQLRSTEGIIYYLGELTRRHLYPEQGKFPAENQPRIIKVPTQVPDGAMPTVACDGDNSGRTFHRGNELVYPSDPDPSGTAHGAAASFYCDDIFVVDQGSDNNAFISVDYDGSSYALAQGPDRSGRTYQVLELAKQILAINTSAKQLPATSVVVISQP